MNISRLPAPVMYVMSPFAPTLPHDSGAAQPVPGASPLL